MEPGARHSTPLHLEAAVAVAHDEVDLREGFPRAQQLVEVLGVRGELTDGAQARGQRVEQQERRGLPGPQVALLVVLQQRRELSELGGGGGCLEALHQAALRRCACCKGREGSVLPHGLVQVRLAQPGLGPVIPGCQGLRVADGIPLLAGVCSGERPVGIGEHFFQDAPQRRVCAAHGGARRAQRHCFFGASRGHKEGGERALRRRMRGEVNGLAGSFGGVGSGRPPQGRQAGSAPGTGVC